MVMSKRPKRDLAEIEKTGIQVLGLDQGINEVVRKGLASLVMLGESLEDLVIPAPILQHLRRSLNEICLRGGAMEAGETSLGTHSMHGMAKFMKIGDHLTMLQ